MSMLTADLLRRSDVGARDVEQQIEIAWTQWVLYVENKKGSIKHAHTGEKLRKPIELVEISSVVRRSLCT